MRMNKRDLETLLLTILPMEKNKKNTELIKKSIENAINENLVELSPKEEIILICNNLLNLDQNMLSRTVKSIDILTIKNLAKNIKEAEE